MYSFLNRYFNTWKTHVILKNCLADCYSAIERRAIADVQSKIKAFLFQYGEKTLLRDVYDNPGKFNPLYTGQKPITQKKYTISELTPLTSIKGEIVPFLLLMAGRLKSKSVLEYIIQLSKNDFIN